MEACHNNYNNTANCCLFKFSTIYHCIFNFFSVKLQKERKKSILFYFNPDEILSFYFNTNNFNKLDSAILPSGEHDRDKGTLI